MSDRSDSRSRSRSPPANAEQRRSSRRDATGAGAGGAAEHDEERDSDWDPEEHSESEDNEDANDEEDDDGATRPADAARIVSAILRQLGGGANVELNAESMQAVLRGLAQRGLLHQDEDGNLVMEAGDIDLDAEDEEHDHQHDDDEDNDQESVNEEDAANEPIQKDEAALAEYAHTMRLDRHYPTNVLRAVESLQRSHHTRPAPESQYSSLAAHHIPSICTSTEDFEGRAFCGKFSHGSASEGGVSRFATATQDGKIHLFETSNWKLYKEIEARDIGWSIVDIDFSSDSRFVIYSSWSNCVHLINTQGEFELHEALDFDPHARHRQHVCMFGIRFSPNGSREILAGLNGGMAMLYDVERKRTIWSAQAHDDDINTVTWLDSSGDLFATGSDDASIRIWDRRLLNSSIDTDDAADPNVLRSRYSTATPVGAFVGHVHGLTCVAAHPDGTGRYLLSNGKDQCMKLWDTRRMAAPGALEAAEADRAASRRMVDYRWQRLSRRDVTTSAVAQRQQERDTSLVTFTGHSVVQTLIRCDFSPMHTTGSRYAITGSANGTICVFDILTGRLAQRLTGHQSIVRDVAWQDDLIVSSSWDHSVKRYAVTKETNLFDNEPLRADRAAQMPHWQRRRAMMGDDDDEEEEE